MAKASGTVSRVYSRDWKGKGGKTTLYSFQLEDDKRYYRTGEDDVVSEGQTIRFEYEVEENGQYTNNNVDTSTIEEIEESDVKKAPKPKGGSSGTSRPASAPKSGSGSSRDDYWDAKAKREIEVVEPRITVASAQSDAVALVAAALAADILHFGNANKLAKLPMLLEYVDQVTKKFAVTRFNAAAYLSVAQDEADSAGDDDKGGDSGDEEDE